MIGRRGTWLTGLVLGLAICTATPSVARTAHHGQKPSPSKARGKTTVAPTPCAHRVKRRLVKRRHGKRKIRRCSLSFLTQPRDVQVGSPISGAPADPSGPPVTIAVRDRGGHPTTAAIPVTIGLGTAPPGATLQGTRTVTSVDGLARFANLSVSAPGTYTLTVTSPAAAPASSSTSQPFVAAQGLTSCENDGAPCTASATTTRVVPGSRPPRRYTNSVTVAAPPNPAVHDDSGTLAVSYDVGPDIACKGYAFASPDREAISGPTREKTVVSTVSKALLDASGRKPSSLRTCLLAPYRFNLGLPLVGGTARRVGDVDHDGHADYLGLLPNCLELLRPILGIPILISPPCQVSAAADEAGNGVVTYRLPADPRDPLGRH
jgi:hypothetical protein